MSLLGKSSIFEGISNQFQLDPSTIRMLSDRVLLKDLGDIEKEGLIIIPEKYRERGLNANGTYRVGIVIAVGHGDRFLECGITEENQVRRKLLTAPCGLCDAGGAMVDVMNGEPVVCPRCEGSGRQPVCVPPQCMPGDVVMFERRREAEVYLHGERYVLCHAEQAVIVVLEEE